ncbi:MAG TPA: GNAT family N-acetyltransferase [Gammaproteobacteria bacterium]
MSSPDPQLLDLREHARPDLLAAFVDLYTRTFTDPSEREDPAQWPPRLYGDLPAPQPRMHLLVAVAGDADSSARDDAQPEILGGMAFEYYRDSRCGLLTYLVTDPAHRRRGLARRLIRQAVALLQRDASESGAELRGVFSETEDPRQVGAQGNAMSPRDRLTALARLGARRIDIPYVQPALEGGSGRCRHLLLLAFYPDAAQAAHIEGGVVRDFLHEFYRALGVEQPHTDLDFRAMETALATAPALQAL